MPQHVWRYELGGYPIIKKQFGYRDAQRRPVHGLTHDEFDQIAPRFHQPGLEKTLRELEGG